MTEFEIPKINANTHAIGYGRYTITEKERIALMQAKGCPVNKNVHTKMARSSFRKMCLKYQKMAGVTPKMVEKQEVKAVRMTLYGWKSSNKYMCPSCKIGMDVRNNKQFAPPINMKFVDLGPGTHKQNPKAPRTQATQKLNIKDVIRIRKMYNEKFTIAGIMEIFPKVARTTISDVVNRVTWKHI